MIELEHGGEAAVGGDAAHGGDDDVVDRQRIKLEQRARRRRSGVAAAASMKSPHVRRGEHIRQADGAHAGGLLFEEIGEHGARSRRRSAACLKAHRAEAGERAFLVAHLLAARCELVRAFNSASKSGMQARRYGRNWARAGAAAARTDWRGRPSVNGWLASIIRSARSPSCASTARNSIVADRGGGVAPPQRHVEIGVLAAQELDDPQAGAAAQAERPDEQRRARGVEADDDKRRHAFGGADMPMPEAEEIEGLIGRRQRVRRASSARQCGSAAAMSVKTSTRAIRDVGGRRARRLSWLKDR